MTGSFRMARLCFAVIAAIALAAPTASLALAQNAKTIRLVVPFPTGGTTDTLARLLAQQVTQTSGNTVLTENRPGASTLIATEFVYRAAPDGTTLLLMANSFVINPSLRSTTPYDPFAFEPVCLLVNSPQVFVVNESSPYKTLQSFVMAAKAKPGDYNYAAVGPGSTQHIAGEMFKRAAEIDLTYVPYPGGAPAVNALLGGHVTAVLTNYSEVMEQIKAGKLRPLAVTSRKRIAPLPDVPTMLELGYAGVEATAWFGMMAPPKTSRQTSAQLIALFKGALEAPDVAAKLIAQGLYPAGICGTDFEAHLKQQFDGYARIVKDANIKLE
jgi:tripartite-type tricarboxylate transporter receptor subunit TctC